MLNILKKYFDKSKESSASSGSEDDQHSLMVAVCALLLEIAYSDDEFSREEKTRLENAVKTEFGLSGDEADRLLEAAEKEREKSVDLWHFTSIINENYSVEEKIMLLELMWEVVYADSVLDRHEDYLMHKLTKLLKLEYRQMIAAKLKAKPT